MGKLVLCVDDEETGLSIRKLLLQAEGYEVLTAISGREAIRLLTSEQVDAVVLDYFMPGMDGEATATEMRRIRPEIPIVVLSAYTELPPRLRQMINGFIIKGGDPAELLKTIEAVLQC